MKIQKTATGSPIFNFVDYFTGHTRASGWFADRFGHVRRHFHGDFIGTMEGDELVLVEKLYYTAGETEERVWRVKVSEDGHFAAHSDSLRGSAMGWTEGNALKMRYTMIVPVNGAKTWDLRMQDNMFLQPDGSLHNVNHVSKWGVRIGTVCTHFHRVETNQLCDIAA